MAASSHSARTAAMASSNDAELVQRAQLVLVAEQDVDLVARRGRRSRRGGGRRRTSPTASATPCGRWRGRCRRPAGTPPWRRRGRTGSPPCTARRRRRWRPRRGRPDEQRLDTPRYVFIVRWASGVTTMMHRPVGVSACGAPGRKATPTASQVVAEHVAEVVGRHLADVGGAAAEAGDAAHRVGRRPAAHLHGRAERAVQVHGAVGVDQRHRALDERVLARGTRRRRGR